MAQSEKFIQLIVLTQSFFFLPFLSGQVILESIILENTFCGGYFNSIERARTRKEVNLLIDITNRFASGLSIDEPVVPVGPGIYQDV